MEQLLRRVLQPLLDIVDPGIQIHRLAVAVALDERGIIARVVGHHHHGRFIEPVDQRAHLVVHGEVERPAHDLHALFPAPCFCSVEQRIGHGLVIDALEEAERAHQFVMDLVVPVVDDGADRADQLAVAPREE